MSNRYRDYFENITPDKSLMEDTIRKMQEELNSEPKTAVFNIKPVAAVAACVAVTASAIIFTPGMKNINDPGNDGQSVENIKETSAVTEEPETSDNTAADGTYTEISAENQTETESVSEISGSPESITETASENKITASDKSDSTGTLSSENSTAKTSPKPASTEKTESTGRPADETAATKPASPATQSPAIKPTATVKPTSSASSSPSVKPTATAKPTSSSASPSLKPTATAKPTYSSASPSLKPTATAKPTSSATVTPPATSSAAPTNSSNADEPENTWPAEDAPTPAYPAHTAGPTATSAPTEYYTAAPTSDPATSPTEAPNSTGTTDGIKPGDTGSNGQQEYELLYVNDTKVYLYYGTSCTVEFPADTTDRTFEYAENILGENFLPDSISSEITDCYSAEGDDSLSSGIIINVGDEWPLIFSGKKFINAVVSPHRTDYGYEQTYTDQKYSRINGKQVFMGINENYEDTYFCRFEWNGLRYRMVFKGYSIDDVVTILSEI